MIAVTIGGFKDNVFFFGPSPLICRPFGVIIRFHFVLHIFGEREHRIVATKAGSLRHKTVSNGNIVTNHVNDPFRANQPDHFLPTRATNKINL